MPAWDDLEAFTDPDDFGVWAVIAYQDGTTSAPIAVLFDEPATGLAFEHRNPTAKTARLGTFEADAENPTMVGLASRLALIQRRDGVQIADRVQNGALVNPRTFAALTGMQPDGTGMARVVLSEQA